MMCNQVKGKIYLKKVKRKIILCSYAPFQLDSQLPDPLLTSQPTDRDYEINEGLKGTSCMVHKER